MKRLLLAAVVLSHVLASPIAAQAQDPAPLSYENHLTCAVMFFVLADRQADAETKEAFNAGMGVLLRRAATLPEARGLDQDALIDAAAVRLGTLQAKLSGIADADGQTAAIFSYGPGIDACVQEVSTQR